MLISKFDNSYIADSLVELEKRYNLMLPEKYRQFLLKYNGGKTPETEFRINGVSSDIQGFYGLGNADANYHFDTIEKCAKVDEWLKDKMFPIAINSFGDYIMINIDDERRGAVYFYYHDKPVKYIFLAEDFALFIKECKSKKIRHARTIEERKNDMIKQGKGNKITPEKLAGWQAEIDEFANVRQEEVVLD